ncbi:MAG TPA: hypothetical protein VIG32_06035 [Candidatus Baltobacteraceae bacterium]|jgi:outer membrane lipoprotein-sorting protein
MNAQRTRFFSLTLGFAALALILAHGALRAAPVPALAAFDDAFAKVHDYTVTLRAHEVSGSRTQDRVYHYWYRKPNDAKIEIASGEGAGGGGVWTGGDQVSGHQGGFLISKFHLKVGLHDGRAVSLRGYTIPDGLFPNEVEKYRTIKGQLSEGAGPTVDGQATDAVTLNVADPAAVGGVTRMVLDLSKATHMPVRQIRYQGDQIVADEIWSELKTNVGLSERDFPF